MKNFYNNHNDKTAAGNKITSESVKTTEDKTVSESHNSENDKYDENNFNNQKEPSIKNNTDLKKEKNKKKPTNRKRILKITTIVCAVIIILPLIAFGIGVAGFKIWAKDVELDTSLLPTASALPMFYDSEGNKLDYADDNYLFPDDIPENLKNAFVSLEDKRFYKHKGYDVIRMGGAIVSNLKSGRLKEGASTITQQLVKNTHLTQERTLKRKLKEVAIAEKVEKRYSKNEILAMYLSVIYFGGGAYGVNAASKLYFDKTPSQLSLSECATLAGIVKNPSKYSPKNSKKNAEERRNIVLNAMLDNNAISANECENAKQEEIVITNVQSKRSVNKYYLDRVIEEVTSALNITKYQLNNSGYKIYTNLDANLQDNLAKQAKNGSNFSREITENEALIIDNMTGSVLAHYSSLPYKISRQAGSTLKPLAVYAPALDRGLINLSSPIVDEKINFGGYSPDNYGGIYYGNTNPREAIKKSMNSVAVKLIDSLGAENAAAQVERFGIKLSDGDANYSLALGATAKGVQPTQLAAAYSTFARGGIRVAPHYVKYVVKNDNKVLDYLSDEENTVIIGTRAVSNDTAYLITSALNDTVRDGTAKGLSALPFSVAAKTGTASRNGKNTDAWNVGYTTAHTVLVWHGEADNEAISEQGGGAATRHAANIWKGMYSNGFSPADFVKPNTVCEAEIDVYSTVKNKRVTLSGLTTPAQFRKKELFSLSNMPQNRDGYFDAIKPVDFDLQLIGKTVSLSFAPLDVYRYVVERKDVLGTKIIKIADINDANDRGFIILTDRPLSLGGAVEYTVYAQSIYDKDGLSGTGPRSSKTKTVFVSPYAHN